MFEPFFQASFRMVRRSRISAPRACLALPAIRARTLPSKTL